MTNLIFKSFDTAVDTFDFLLKKNWNQTYVLEVTAISQGKKIQTQVIILETDKLDLAVKKTLKVINEAARNIAPGIKELGDLRGRTKIKLVPARPQVAPGIYLLEDREEIPEDCRCCEDFYDCYSDEYFDEDYDDYDDYDDEEEYEDPADIAEELAEIIERLIDAKVRLR